MGVTGWLGECGFLLIIIFHPKFTEPLPSAKFVLGNGNISSHTGYKAHPLRGLDVGMLTPSDLGWGSYEEQPQSALFKLMGFILFRGTQAPPGSLLPATLGAERRLLFQSPVPELLEVPQKCPASPGFAFPRATLPSLLRSPQFRDQHAVEGSSLPQDYRERGYPAPSSGEGPLTNSPPSQPVGPTGNPKISPSFWSELVWQHGGNISSWLTLPTGELAISAKKEKKRKKRTKGVEGSAENYLKYSKILLACKCKFTLRNPNKLAPSPCVSSLTLASLAVQFCCHAIWFVARL